MRKEVRKREGAVLVQEIRGMLRDAKPARGLWRLQQEKHLENGREPSPWMQSEALSFYLMGRG